MKSPTAHLIHGYLGAGKTTFAKRLGAETGARDVILDFGFWTRARRDAARSRATAAGAEHVLYWIRCSEQIARRRCRIRNQSPGDSLFIADATFDALKSEFEPLDPDEPFELVDTDSAR